MSYYYYNKKTKTSKQVTLKTILANFKINRKSWNSRTLSNIITADTETNIDIIDEFNEKNKKIGEKRRGYVVMGQINIDGLCFYCRTCDELVALFDGISAKISKESKGEKKPKVRVYFHNLAYDFYFMKLFLKEHASVDIFGEETSVIYANYKNIQFCCSYKLFDASLASLCESYNIKDENKKIKNGWDYKKNRTPYTVLTPLEIEYGMNDIISLYELIKIKAEEWGGVEKIPYTKTGEVRESIKKYSKIAKYYTKFDEFSKYTIVDLTNDENIKVNNRKVTGVTLTNKISKGKNVIYVYKHHRIIIRNEKKKSYSLQTIWEYDSHKKEYAYAKINNVDDFKKCYFMMVYTFAGGFVKGVQDYIGITLKRVVSYDLTSAYPAMCLTKKFGLGFKLCTDWHKYYNKQTMQFDTSKYQFMFIAEFHNIKAKHGISLFSVSKSEELTKQEFKDLYDIDLEVKINKKDPDDYDNGRVKHAELIPVALIADEFNHYSKFYSWDSVKFIQVYKAPKDYLPDTIIQSTNEFYSDKCEYKFELADLNETDPEYDVVALKLYIAKTKLNSIYGCMATNLLKYEVPENLTDEEEMELTKEFFDNYYHCTRLPGREVSKYFSPLAFDYAMQITAYVRCTIYTLIEALNFKNIIYSDTDSLKIQVMNDEDNEFIKQQVEKINEVIIQEVKDCQKERNFNMDKWKQGKKGQEKTIQWIGVFDNDGEYEYFRTLGAKRYAYVYKKKNKKTGQIETLFKTVCAGIGKKTLSTWIARKVGIDLNEFKLNPTTGDKKALMRNFNFDINIPQAESHKQTHLYCSPDKNNETKVVTWNDPNSWNDGIRSGSFILLKDAPFKPKGRGSLIYDVFVNNIRRHQVTHICDNLTEAIGAEDYV